MPTYHYRCKKCSHEYEKFQKMSDTTVPACPECGAKGERVISGGAGLLFKGSGFYITDYGRSGSKSTEDSSEAKSGAKKESSDTKGGDSGSSSKKAGDES